MSTKYIICTDFLPRKKCRTVHVLLPSWQQRWGNGAPAAWSAGQLDKCSPITAAAEDWLADMLLLTYCLLC
jgi:hypothetical protein